MVITGKKMEHTWETTVKMMIRLTFVDNDGIIFSDADESSTKNSIKKSAITELDVTATNLMAFASLIHQESEGDSEESYSIGNVTMNFISQGGSSELKTLEDVVLVPASAI